MSPIARTAVRACGLVRQRCEHVVCAALQALAADKDLVHVAAVGARASAAWGFLDRSD